jgi:hypothetical protein
MNQDTVAAILAAKGFTTNSLYTEVEKPHLMRFSGASTLTKNIPIDMIQTSFLGNKLIEVILFMPSVNDSDRQEQRVLEVQKFVEMTYFIDTCHVPFAARELEHEIWGFELRRIYRGGHMSVAILSDPEGDSEYYLNIVYSDERLKNGLYKKKR